MCAVFLTVGGPGLSPEWATSHRAPAEALRFVTARRLSASSAAPLARADGGVIRVARATVAHTPLAGRAASALPGKRPP